MVSVVSDNYGLAVVASFYYVAYHILLLKGLFPLRMLATIAINRKKPNITI